MAVFASVGSHHHTGCSLHCDEVDRAMVPYFPPPIGRNGSEGIIHPHVGDPHTYFQQLRRIKRKRTQKTPVRQCSMIQIIVGFTLIVTALVMMKHGAWGSGLGIGFWGCIFYFSAGIFGILAFKLKTTCCILGSCIFSFSTCILSTAVVTMGCIGINLDSTEERNSKLVLHCVNLVLGFLGVITAYVQLSHGCHALCRGKRCQKDGDQASTSPSLNNELGSTRSIPGSLDNVVSCTQPPLPEYDPSPAQELPPSYEDVMKQKQRFLPNVPANTKGTC